MKVGILTFHSALNYGAVLQCHGLYSTIKALGHDVYVIDYRPPYLYFPRPEVGKKQWLFHPIDAWKLYKSTSNWRTSYDKFFAFQKRYWKRTQPIFSADQLRKVTDLFDIIVVGSDQVWASKHNGNDPIWYGIKDSKAKWITYAASAGDPNFSEEELVILQERLQTFNAISVREEKLGNLIGGILGKSIPTVLDPTLLAAPEIWKPFCKPIIDGDYVVVYQARPDDNTFRIAEEIKKQLGIEKIVVLDTHSNVKKFGYKPYCASPSEFVSIIANSKYLVTTSFHGTAFAIITGVPFLTLKLNDGADERSENLLSAFQMKSRFVDKNSSIIFPDCNINTYMEILRSYRCQSMTYIENVFCSNK